MADDPLKDAGSSPSPVFDQTSNRDYATKLSREARAFMGSNLNTDFWIMFRVKAVILLPAAENSAGEMESVASPRAPQPPA